jgi:hypothetical protein
LLLVEKAMQTDAPLAFALTIKKWFKANDWPQKITDDWAKDQGVLYPHGPWASQVCAALKGSGYNPKAEFFIAFARFNQFVAEQDLRSLTDQSLKKRLDGAEPLCLDNGTPYGGAEFWSLFAGLLQPPEAYSSEGEQLTQEDCDLWTATMRDNFRKVSLKYLVSRPEAWELLLDEIKKQAAVKGHPLPIDDIDWLKTVLSGLHDPPLEECLRVAHRAEEMESSPVVAAMESLLGEAESKKPLLTA